MLLGREKKDPKLVHSEFRGKRPKKPQQCVNSAENNQDRARKGTLGVLENRAPPPSHPEEQQAADVQQRPGTRSRSGDHRLARGN